MSTGVGSFQGVLRGGMEQLRFDTLTGDGSTKTFTLSSTPLDVGSSILVGTDDPKVYTPTIDYTFSGADLVLGSSVNAPSNQAKLRVIYRTG